LAEVADKSVELADKSTEFHKKLATKHQSATHVILHVLYHLITIPCHLHQEIKEKSKSPISTDLHQEIKEKVWDLLITERLTSSSAVTN
jgi:LEA14-like dessication related protein